MGYRLSGEQIYETYNSLCNCDVIKIIVDYARGLATKHLLPEPQKRAFVKCGTGMILWTNKGGKIVEYRGLEKLKEIPNLKMDILKQVGDDAVPYRGVGNFSFVSENIEDMISTVDAINKNVQVINDDGEDMVIKYTDFDFLRKVYKEGLEGK